MPSVSAAAASHNRPSPGGTGIHRGERAVYASIRIGNYQRKQGGGQPVLRYEQWFYFISSFPFLFVFAVGGLGFEFCVFIAGWRHALRSEWPFISNITLLLLTQASGQPGGGLLSE